MGASQALPLQVPLPHPVSVGTAMVDSLENGRRLEALGSLSENSSAAQSGRSEAEGDVEHIDWRVCRWRLVQELTRPRRIGSRSTT